MRIAILDDDHAQLVHQSLVLKAPLEPGGEEIACIQFSSGELLRRSLRRETYDLLVLDWNVPDLDGLALLKWLREERKQTTPVLMLSSRDSENDVAHALLAGADDYVIKPFRPLELRARLSRLYARRPAVLDQDALRFGQWEFDRSRNMVRHASPEARLDGQAKTASARSGSSASPTADCVFLTETEFRLALALFRNMGNSVSRDYLVERAGFMGSDSSSRTLDSHIYRLREKLYLKGQRGLSLMTVYGKGYRLEPSTAAPD